MDLQRSAKFKGVFFPKELDFLSRVFVQVITSRDSKQERIDRALATLSLFRAGITDEVTLVTLVSERLFTVDVREAEFAASP